MGKPTVLVDGVGKKFGLSLKAALKYGLLDSARRLAGLDNEHELRSGEFWALNDISFALEAGDALGIMGVNGSGKTTLLRILNGTYAPDRGQVTLRGQVGALIAAGAGFSPMLSGRENIQISGALLGMTPKEITRRFDEIVAFSELSEFLDMPVRNYSSGMSVRLGFAIAVIGTPEILLIDEVLAVGDISFQKKCFERIQALRAEGTTILLVSHSPGAIWSVCNKGLVIHQGQSVGVTSVEDACRAYEENNMRERKRCDAQQTSAALPRDYGGSSGGTGTVLITKVEVLDTAGRPVAELPYGADFTLRCHLSVQERVSKGILRVQVDAEINKAIAIIDNYEAHQKFIDMQSGEHVFDIDIRAPNLRPGVYFFSGSITNRDLGVHLFFKYNQATIVITHPRDVFFYADFRASVHLNSSYRDVTWLEHEPDHNIGQQNVLA